MSGIHPGEIKLWGTGKKINILSVLLSSVCLVHNSTNNWHVRGRGFTLYGLDRLNSGASRPVSTASQGELAAFGALVFASLGFGVIALIVGIVLLASKPNALIRRITKAR